VCVISRHPEPAKRGEGSPNAKNDSTSHGLRILRSFAVYAAQDDGSVLR